MKKIVFTGGGTGGHIMPNLAIIENLKSEYQIYYIGTNGMEKDIISKYPNITFVEIEAVKFIRSLTPKNLLIPFKLFKSIKNTKRLLKEIKPNLIFSKGGFVSIPTCLAANKLNIPVLTHESDLTVGLANKIIARKAKFLCCSFQETADKYGKNSICTGSPIRNSILYGDKQIIIKRHNINNSKPTILIVGGSLGAQSINNIIWDNINSLIEKFNIIHIVGKNKSNNRLIKIKNYIQLEFVNDIENYFMVSDLIISRAGSNTIFELLALHKPMLLIPLSKSSSRGDQILNAENFKKHNYANVLEQENLNFDTLLYKINETLKNKDKYIKAMKKSNIPNGTETITKLIKSII